MTKRSTRKRRQRTSKGVDILKKHLQKPSLSDSTSDTESEGECPMCGWCMEKTMMMDPLGYSVTLVKDGGTYHVQGSVSLTSQIFSLVLTA